MFVVYLECSDNRDRAPELMDGHKTWLTQGFDDEVFLLAGSLQPGRGGAIIAHNTDMESLEARVAEDPFVADNVVTASISEITLARADERLAFPLD